MNSFEDIQVGEPFRVGNLLFDFINNLLYIKVTVNPRAKDKMV